MYEFMSVIKFNGQYFEHGDEVVITKNDNSVIIGSILINGIDDDTNCSLLYIDISEKYHKKIDAILGKDIINIQKVNG